MKQFVPFCFDAFITATNIPLACVTLSILSIINFKYVNKFWTQGRLLPPSNEVCEGYVFTGVCLSTGGVCPIACWNTHTPGQTHPWADTPPPGRHPMSRYPPGQTPPGQTPPADTPPTGQKNPQGTHPPGSDTSPPPSACWIQSPIGCTHPIVMSSCLFMYFLILHYGLALRGPNSNNSSI